MTFTRKLYKHKDNVAAQLNANISAAATSIVLKSGEGALFPTTKNGTATSGGSSTTLNSTGIQALGVAVGDIIENVTDGSYAVVTAVSTNAVTTTRLKGGSDNTWQNADKWHINRFIITLIQYDADGTTVLKREKVLIDSRSSDTLTANASGRGFDGSTAQSFEADDYVYLFLTSAALDGIDEAFAQVIRDIDQAISQGSGEVYAADTVGTDAYAITLSPAPTSYVTGQVFNFQAGTANTGAATLNVNSLGAKTIKKHHDQDLETNDIEVGQIVTVVYDGTYFQMQSQLANVFATTTQVQSGSMVYAADGGASDTYAITLTPAPTAYATGMMLSFKANTANTGAATLNVNSLGAKTIKKNYNENLSTGDIVANQIVTVIYDGTNFQIVSKLSQGTLCASGEETLSVTGNQPATTSTRTVDVGFAPKMVFLSVNVNAVRVSGASGAMQRAEAKITANQIHIFKASISANPGGTGIVAGQPEYSTTITSQTIADTANDANTYTRVKTPSANVLTSNGFTIEIQYRNDGNPVSNAANVGWIAIG